MPYFPAIGCTVAEVLQINGFQIVTVRHFGFQKSEILIAYMVLNFVAIGHTTAEILLFNGFHNGGRQPSQMFKNSNF